MAETASLPPPPPPAYYKQVPMRLPPLASRRDVPIPHNTSDVDADTGSSRKRRSGITRLLNLSLVFGRLRSRKSRNDDANFKSIQVPGTPRLFHVCDDSPAPYEGKESPRYSPPYLPPAQTSEGGMRRHQSALSLQDLEKSSMTKPCSAANLSELDKNGTGMGMAKTSSVTNLADLPKTSMTKYASESNLAGLDRSIGKEYPSTANLTELDRKGDDRADDVDGAEHDNDVEGDIDAKADDFIANFYEQMRLQRIPKPN